MFLCNQRIMHLHTT